MLTLTNILLSAIITWGWNYYAAPDECTETNDQGITRPIKCPIGLVDDSD